VPKYFQTPIPVGHWNAVVSPLVGGKATFEITDTQGTIVLEAIPVAHTPLSLVLPANPTDGDWYEWCDPLSLVGANYHLTVTAADGRYVENAASIGTSTPGGGFKVVYDASIPSPAGGVPGGMWCLVTSNPFPFA
jgi:hypothetical protein